MGYRGGEAADVGRTSGGSEQHLAVIVTLRPQVYSYCRARLRDHHHAEDITAEVIATAWRRLPDVPGQADRAIGWLIRTAENLIRNHVRGEIRRRRLREAAASHADTSQGHVEPSGATAALRRVTAAEAWATMSTEHQQLLGWTASGIDQDMIAERLGIGVGAVRMRVVRARIELAKAFDTHLPSPP